MKEEVKLGELITDVRRRDAIHIAMCPVISGDMLPINPGDEIGILSQKKVGNHTQIIVVGDSYHSFNNLPKKIKMLGIADPFLKQTISKDQQFWMLLFPNTITNLRHEWEHPHFHYDK